MSLRGVSVPFALAAIHLLWTPDARAQESTRDLPRETPHRQEGIGSVTTPSTVAVRGVVRTRRGAPIFEAVVTVLGRPERTVTDERGAFVLELPRGTYELRVAADLFRPIRLRNATLTPAYPLDLVVTLDDQPAEELPAVVADVDRASNEAQLELRKQASSTVDAVGAKEIAKAPDRNAAEAARRVVGATVVDGRYLYVRGLGDRYTNARLDGSPLPSPEPDRQSVPLDMFPTLVLGDLTVHKTFTPDMPGDFAGGSLDIHTRDVPTKWTFAGTIGLGANDRTTFAKGPSARGGSLDFLGFDDGSRKLPKTIPGSRVTRLLPDGSLNSGLGDAGRALSSPMGLTRDTILPNGTASGIVGNTFGLGGERKLGLLFGAGYTNRAQLREGEILRTYGLDATRPGALVRYNDYRVDTATRFVTLSALGSATFEISPKHRLSLRGLFTRNAESEARIVAGFNDEQQTDIRDERQRFLARGLAYTQLRGEHDLSKRTRLTWSLLQARATLDDPDLRETVYAKDRERGLVFREGTQSGQHFFATQGETTRGVGLDLKQALGEKDSAPILKVGALATLRGRSFMARRFRFLRVPSAPGEAFAAPPGELFRPENVGTSIELEEWTRPTDAYGARNDVYAGYAMAEVHPTERLRLTLGERVETAKQSVDSFDPFDANGGRVHAGLDTTDVLPSLGVVVELSKKVALRGVVSRTVARPLLRELAPFVFSDFFGAREILGNPKLERTSIANGDLRLEWFPSATEVFAISLFGKRFSKPIEPIIIPTSRGVVSFGNADSATNVGLELEGRKKLGAILPALSDFALLANLTLVHSEVDLPKAGGIQTSRERPLAGQSPYVMNVALDFERKRTRARLLYNTFGRRVAQVGQNGLPDVYEEGRHQIDLAVSQGIGKNLDLKGSFENLFDAPIRFTTGDAIVQRATVGRTLWLSLTMTN